MADSRDMVIIHRVFRRELALAGDLVRGVGPGDLERASVLGEHVRLVLDVLHHHPEGEDLLLWPRLRARVPEASALLDRMDADHAGLAADLDEIEVALAQWATSVDSVVGERLAGSLDHFRARLVEHLDAEEAEVLPHVDAALTQEEWGELGARAFGLLEPADAMTVLGAMAEDSPAEEWEWFLSHLPPPVQEAHRGHRADYDRYVTTVRA